MPGIRVKIVRYVNDHFPGFVECRVTDANGQVWTFIEKAPVLTTEPLDDASSYPQPGVIACRVEHYHRDTSGRILASVTAFPLRTIPDTLEDPQFDLLADQIEPS
jgi:hypothetical protein